MFTHTGIRNVAEVPITVLRLLKKHPESDYKHRLCAVAFKGSRVVSYGFNRSKTQADIVHIARRTECMYENSLSDWISYCTHAEVHAMKKANADGIDTIVVARHTKSGDVGCAKPCKICQQYLRECDVERVFYTNQHGKFEEFTL